MVRTSIFGMLILDLLVLLLSFLGACLNNIFGAFLCGFTIRKLLELKTRNLAVLMLTLCFMVMLLQFREPSVTDLDYSVLNWYLLFLISSLVDDCVSVGSGPRRNNRGDHTPEPISVWVLASIHCLKRQIPLQIFVTSDLRKNIRYAKFTPVLRDIQVFNIFLLQNIFFISQNFLKEINMARFKIWKPPVH